MMSTKDDDMVVRTKNKRLRWLSSLRRPKVIITIVIFVIILLLLTLSLTLQGKSHRSESYKKATGGAGLSAAIKYDCGDACDQKFDFNIYIYKSNGQQTNVVRPDKDGRVNLALAEGSYVMLIGKQFGKDKVFPQEALALKNGQTLELKLEYK